MPAPWSAKGEKDAIVDDDEFLILDSEDTAPSTTNKRVKRSTVLTDINVLDFFDGSTQTQAASPENFNWHVDTAILGNSFLLTSQTTESVAIVFKIDGTQMYVISGSGSINPSSIIQYTLPIAWDVTSATSPVIVSLSADETDPFGVFFRQDGLKMYVVGLSGKDVNEFDLGTAWDLNGTLTFVASASVSAQETIPSGIFFKPDGTHFYVVGTASHTVFDFILSTPWDLTDTVTYTNNFKLISEDDTTTDLQFKNDGTKMYVCGIDNDSVYEYFLSTPWDVTTATFVESFDFSSEESTVEGIFLKPDGDRLYMTGVGSNTAFEYNLGIKTDGKVISQQLEIENASSGANPVLSSNSVDQELILTGGLNVQFTDPATALRLQDAFGGLFFFNELGASSLFSGQLLLDLAGDTARFVTEVQIPIADDDVGDIDPLAVLDIFRAGPSNIQNRILYELQNNGTPLYNIAADGTWDFEGNTITEVVIQSILPNGSIYVGDETNVSAEIPTGLETKEVCRIATVTNNILAGLGIIDDVTPMAGDRILAKNQSIATENGIYIAAGGTWVRSSDANGTPTTGEVNNGMLTKITEGTVNADTAWVLITANPITLGSDDLTFEEFNLVTGSLPVPDTVSIVEGSDDNTKQLRFEIDGFTTATKRVITPPDADITLVNTPNGSITNSNLTAGSFTNITGVGILTDGTWNADTIAVANGGTGVTSSTGTINVVLSNSPTLVTPNLGTPASGDATNLTNIPMGNATGTLAVANGGTGATSLTSGGVLFGTGTTAITSNAVATGNILFGDSGTATIGIMSGDATIDNTGAVTLVSTVVQTDQANTWSTGIQSFAAATNLRIPVSASPTIAVNGDIAFDTTVNDFSTGVIKFFGTEEQGIVTMPLGEFTTPINGNLIAYNAANDEFELTSSITLPEIAEPALPSSNTGIYYVHNDDLTGDSAPWFKDDAGNAFKLQNKQIIVQSYSRTNPTNNSFFALSGNTTFEASRLDAEVVMPRATYFSNQTIQVSTGNPGGIVAVQLRFNGTNQYNFNIPADGTGAFTIGDRRDLAAINDRVVYSFGGGIDVAFMVASCSIVAWDGSD